MGPQRRARRTLTATGPAATGATATTATIVKVMRLVIRSPQPVSHAPDGLQGESVSELLAELSDVHVRLAGARLRPSRAWVKSRLSAHAYPRAGG